MLPLHSCIFDTAARKCVLKHHARQCDTHGNHLKELVGAGTMEVGVQFWPNGWSIGSCAGWPSFDPTIGHVIQFPFFLSVSYSTTQQQHPAVAAVRKVKGGFRKESCTLKLGCVQCTTTACVVPNACKQKMMTYHWSSKNATFKDFKDDALFGKLRRLPRSVSLVCHPVKLFNVSHRASYSHAFQSVCNLRGWGSYSRPWTLDTGRCCLTYLH